jgi:hypothetical protein
MAKYRLVGNGQWVDVKKIPALREREDVDHVSDALGFPTRQLAEMETHRRAVGAVGVSFKPDPKLPEFTQVHAGSRRELLRYARERGMVDQGKTGTVFLSADDFRRARELAERAAHGTAQTTQG